MMQKIEKIKVQLERDLKETEAEIAGLDASNEENESSRQMISALDEDYEGTEIQIQHDSVLGIVEKKRTQIIAALDRIKNNKYGICINCQSKIPALRLEAIPYTAYCIKCQSQLEGKG